MLRRSLLFSVLLLLPGALICGAVLAAKTYSDPVGDVKGGTGPDVTAVAISNTASTVTFRVRFADAPPLRVHPRGRWVDMLLIGIDVPPLGPSPVTSGGEWRGADFAVGTHGPSRTGRLVRLGKDHSAPPLRIKIDTRGRIVSFSIPRAALGNPRWFAFSVAAAREGETDARGGGFDVAPARATFRYRFPD